ncbi:hypothetical protein ACNPKZ_04155 [Shewanella algae]|uniref:hypothetical protein n=1 Tax=Shewanella algae TaxID=38313 RepID=UPI003AADE3DE|nr:hypothetical protein [Shewanella algae]
MTPYAQSLVDYVCQHSGRDEGAAAAFLDSCLDPLWQMMTEQPKAGTVTVNEVADE